LSVCGKAEVGQGFEDLHGFQADGDDLPYEAHDVLLVVGAVGIIDDAAALITEYCKG